MEIRPLLLAPVSLLRRHILLRLGQVPLELLVDVVDDRLMQRLLVPLQRQHIVGLARDDLLGDRLLRAHRVDGDDAPLMSTSRSSSGIAVISFDFSAQATCPRDRPYSLAHMLTECKAPRPFLRSWLRRKVLPSTGRTGCSTPVCASPRPQRLQPADEAGLEGGRLQRHQDAPEDILARDPVGQVEHLHEELPFRPPSGRSRWARRHRRAPPAWR